MIAGLFIWEYLKRLGRRESDQVETSTGKCQGLSNQLCNFLISERGQRHALFPEHHLEALQCRLPVVNLLPVA